MRLLVNDADVKVDDRHAKTPLLWVLRDVLGLRGPKFGCGVGYCAACTVLVDGRNTKSCQRGVACSSFLSSSAQVIEVSLDDRARVHIDRVVYALDCGIEVNPDLIRAQVEGGILFGLSAAARGEVVLVNDREIVTQNFDRDPVIRMRSVPTIEVHLTESTEAPTGVGEVRVPSTAPALTNAIAALTGNRVRELPIHKTIKVA